MGIVDEAVEAVRGKGKDQASASQGKCECDRGKNSRRGKGEGRYEGLGGQGTLGKVHSTSTQVGLRSIYGYSLQGSVLLIHLRSGKVVLTAAPFRWAPASQGRSTFGLICKILEMNNSDEIF